MSGAINASITAVTSLSSFVLHPLVPAVLLAFASYTPPTLLHIIPRLGEIHKLLESKSIIDRRTLLRILLAGGFVRYLNTAASRWALNNWRLQSHPGWRWNEELAVVTGGCSGIGRAIAIGLAQKGVTVAILDIQPMPEYLRSNNALKYWKCDISSPSAVRDTADEIKRVLGHPSIVVNNAGVAYSHSVLETDDDSLKKIFGVNLLSLWSTTREFLPHMISVNKGHIVTIASMASYGVLPMAVDYSATKAGALAFHEGLSCEIRHVFKTDGILTTIVHPGFVRTGLTIRHADKIERTHGPMMQPEYLALRVLRQVFSARGGQLIIPDNMSWISGIRGLPSWIQETMRDVAGKEVNKWK